MAALHQLAGAFKRHWRKLAGAALGMAVLVGTLNIWLVKSCSAAVYRDISTLPSRDVGLVLGTVRLLRSGSVNPHFQARIDAAAELYRQGKARHLLLSGDNHRRGYDEPTDMKEALLAKGVPGSVMTLDYAGFRTLDSVVRAKKVFGQTKLTLITDDFHAPRAVFLSRHFGIDAVAFSAEPVSLNRSIRSRVRELAARVKAVLDVYFLHTRPKFLGETIEIKPS
jgi:SanA protein